MCLAIRFLQGVFGLGSSGCPRVGGPLKDFNDANENRSAVAVPLDVHGRRMESPQTCAWKSELFAETARPLAAAAQDQHSDVRAFPPLPVTTLLYVFNA